MWLPLLIIILHCLSMQVHQVLSSSSSSISNPNHLCPHQHRLILLQFKHMFTINTTDESFCGDYDEPSYPKTLSWNENSTNCCSWDGVTCDDLTGHVIGIDLTCSQLSGSFHPNTTLFQLPLTSLNLSFNNFQQTHIPSSIGMLAPTLTHLNISYSNFTGPTPSEIAHLSKLVVLRLSEDYSSEDTPSLLRLEQHGFENIITNLTQLEILSLVNIDMSSSIIPDSIVNLTSLTKLSLVDNGLYGQVPDGVFNLPALQKLHIRYNDGLKGSFHSVNWNISGTPPLLEDLQLSSISLSGGLPDSIGHLPSLNYLVIIHCNLSGSLPGSIGNLSQLITLTLFSNKFSGLIPRSLSNLSELNYLYLYDNQFEGSIPVGLFGLPNLVHLRVDDNMLSGKIPSLFGLPNLVELRLDNNMLSGQIPSLFGLPNLVDLRLDNNMLSGQIPSLFGLPNLVELRLDNNMLSGALPSIFFNNHSMLAYFIISINNLSGPIPPSISNLTDLFVLDLSFNNFDGTLHLDTFSNTKHLDFIGLNNNRNLSVVDTDGNFSTIAYLELSSCKLQNFPVKFLTTSRNLQHLDISNTGVNGQIPEWIGEMSSMRVFLASNNTLKGEIPSSICNMSSLEVLNLSQNEFEGPIHQCLGNFSAKLSVLDLRMNHFHGGIPTTYAKGNMLRTLALNENQLQGPIPESLSLCNNLQVLDLGNNLINGTFPRWLDALPELEVLVLRSNRLHGFIEMNLKAHSPFLKLHIFDISHNQFTGRLPSWYFNNFYAMKTVNLSSSGHELYMIKEYIYKFSDGSTYTYQYQDSVTITTKGLDAHLQGISFPRITIDLSSNKFEGSISDVVGILVGLTMLNMSNNHLTGPIPESLGNLVHLESLDLSSNHLTGEIPQELTSLTFLAVLNLSCNELEGQIPQGKQFDTFSNTSYMENKALFGLPLTRKCQGHEIAPPHPAHDDSEDDSYFAFSGFCWVIIV